MTENFKNISPTSIHKATGIPLRTLQDWKAGKRHPTKVGHLKKLAEYFKIDFIEFLKMIGE